MRQNESGIIKIRPSLLKSDRFAPSRFLISILFYVRNKLLPQAGKEAHMIKISPSILACDFLKLGDEIKDITAAGADMIHLDVMDGLFVSNISFGFPIVEAIRKESEATLDVHLMIDKPERYIERFVSVGTDMITFHIEATDEPRKCIEMIKSHGKSAAVAIKPNTPPESVFPYLSLCDMVLVMTVEPGYGGQALIESTLDKITILRAEALKNGYDIDIQVDGGINAANAPTVISRGANVLVAGSSVFKAKDRAHAIEALRCKN